MLSASSKNPHFILQDSSFELFISYVFPDTYIQFLGCNPHVKHENRAVTKNPPMYGHIVTSGLPAWREDALTPASAQGLYFHIIF